MSLPVILVSILAGLGFSIGLLMTLLFWGLIASEGVKLGRHLSAWLRDRVGGRKPLANTDPLES